MEIITQNYEKILEKLIINNFSQIIKQSNNANPNENKVFNYIRMLDTLDERICDIALNSLKTIIESIDQGYRNSFDRRHQFHIKARTSRTIMTIFGEITYRKTIYSYKHKKGSYCYIDDYLGLKKYDYFDPYIKALVINYAADNPYTKVAKIINDMIGNRIKTFEPFQYITKQTIRNIILTSTLSNPEPTELPTPENLYIMADEKYIATQNNNNQDVMIKQIVVFDDRKYYKKRCSLVNKQVFASFNSTKFLDNALDYLYYTYNLEKVKNIYIMGDGAKWIKSLTLHFKINHDTNITFNLDRFHFMQAIHHIALDPELDSILASYVLNNDKKTFNQICDAILSKYPHRSDTINEKRNYILSNWRFINNLHSNHLKCPMESQISHNLAALFSSRPKAYSISSLNKLLILRLLFKNKHNLKLLFLNNFNISNVLTINKKLINFSLFDKKFKSPSLDKNLIPYNYHDTFHTDNTVWGLNFSTKIYEF